MWALRFGNSILKLLHRNETAAVAATPSQLGYQTHYLTFHALAVDAIVEACQRAEVTVVRAPYDFSAAVRNEIVLDPDRNVIELCRGRGVKTRVGESLLADEARRAGADVGLKSRPARSPFPLAREDPRHAPQGAARRAGTRLKSAPGQCPFHG
jgi:hypothetical protein